MKTLLCVTALSMWTAAAVAYDSNSAPLVIAGAMMTPVSSGTATGVSGTGPAWSMNVANAGWSEGYAYTIFQIAPGTRAQLTGGTVQNTITDGGQGWYWGDVVLFASAVDPRSPIAGKVPGPTGSCPAPGVLAWMSDTQYGDPAVYATKEAANNAGYRYFGGYDGFASYLDAIGGYSSNVENFRDGGLPFYGGAFAGWNEGSATSMAAGTPARFLTDTLYPAGGGLNRALKDQTYAFDGAVCSGTESLFVTVMVRGGGGGGGSILVSNLVVSFSSPGSLKVTGAMMNPVLLAGSSATVIGSGDEWSLNVTGSSEAEAYACATFMVGPRTRVQLAGGSIKNTITGSSWWYGDLVFFASSVNPRAPIAGNVSGPAVPGTDANPPPGVMAYLTYQKFKDNGYKLLYRSKETVNNAGYRYMDNNGTCGSYLEAISQYASNIENFRDGGLEIDGGSHAGWNQVLYPFMVAAEPVAHPLSEILYPAWGGLNRPLKDQTYAFDGGLCTGTNMAFVTVMLRGGGGNGTGGVITVNDLTLLITPLADHSHDPTILYLR